MQFSLLSIISLQLAAAIQITSPSFGDVIHRNQLFTMKWDLDTGDAAEYILGIKREESTWLVQDGKFKVHTDKLSQKFWGAIFPEPGEWALLLYPVGSTDSDMPIRSSDYFTVV